MGDITKSAQLIDNEIDKKDQNNPPWDFDFIKFSSEKFSPKMTWDSEGNEGGSTTIDLILKNVRDSKTLTIMKRQNQVVEKYIKNARLKKLKGDKQGGIDFFQIAYKIDGKLTSLYLQDPQVIHSETITKNNTAFFVFTLKSEKEPKIGGVGVQVRNTKKVD